MPYLDPNAQREFSRIWMHARREAWIKSQGGECVLCGSTESLEVDHADPSTKSMNPRDIWGRSEDGRLTELAKCQVLCNTCHKDKTRRDRRGALPPHGLSAYKLGLCRCDEICRPANTAYKRLYRAKIKQARLMEQQT